ncbi:MAG: hypothetical protein AB8F95_19950 [Bacteroidia bacterium]
MNVIEVNNKALIREFLELPVAIYKDIPQWVRPWDKDIEVVFDKDKNKFFKHGSAIRWVLRDDSGKTIGRVAAFINEKEANTFDQPTGGMGFFECINDREAANLLFDTCKKWLEERGMEAMDGPINFGERNAWWGLLVEGYEYPPTYQFNYQPPYYRDFFESYGFQVYYKQFCYHRSSEEMLNENVGRMAERLFNKKGYNFKSLDWKNIDYFIDVTTEIYNTAWVEHETFKPMKRSHIAGLFKQMKPISDPNLALFAFYEDKPIGFFVCIPDINPIIKKLNGKFNLWSKLKFKYYQLRGESRVFTGILFGIIPRYQGRGITNAFAKLMQNNAQERKRYDTFEMGWLGDFNPTMLHIADAVDTENHKVLHTYRKLFDETKEFKRRPIIGKTN